MTGLAAIRHFAAAAAGGGPGPPATAESNWAAAEHVLALTMARKVAAIPSAGLGDCVASEPGPGSHHYPSLYLYDHGYCGPLRPAGSRNLSLN